MSKIKTFFRLSPVTQLLFIEALFLLPLCQCSVKLLHFKHLIKLFKLKPCNTPSSSQITTSKDIVELVGWVIYKALSIPGPSRARCLAQALTARILLHQQGQKCVLTIGAAIGDQTMIAHAWLYCGEIVVAGKKEIEKYQKIASYK